MIKMPLGTLIFRKYIQGKARDRKQRIMYLFELLKQVRKQGIKRIVKRQILLKIKNEKMF